MYNLNDQVPVDVKPSEAVTKGGPSANTSLATSSILNEAGDAETQSPRTFSSVAEGLSQSPEQIPASFSQATLMTADKPAPTADPSQFSEELSPVDPQTSNSTDRPLNITDALNYIDAVKAQFHDQPHVYNHFLDIMKEFKNNLIDTPGVMKRVVHLFNGHPSLIQGFNTFLPVGYRIECSADVHNPDIITIITPTGTTVQSADPPDKAPGGHLDDAASNDAEPLANTDIPPSVQPPDTRTLAVEEQSIEPAAHYVRKMKYHSHPETYRHFLKTLFQHQDEHKVFKQIVELLKDAPDLRSDFRPFMSDQSQRLLEDPPAFNTPSDKGLLQKETSTIDVNEKRNHRKCSKLRAHTLRILLLALAFALLFHCFLALRRNAY